MCITQTQYASLAGIGYLFIDRSAASFPVIFPDLSFTMTSVRLRVPIDVHNRLLALQESWGSPNVGAVVAYIVQR